METDHALLAGAIAIGVGLVKVLDVAVAAAVKKKNGRSGNGVGTDSETARKVGELHDWHKKTDDEGRFVWYLPRALLEDILTEARETNKLLRGMNTRIGALRCSLKDDRS